MQIWQKVILLILDILYNFYDIESKEGVETLRNMFRMAHECLVFYSFSLDFFVCLFLLYFQVNCNQLWLFMCYSMVGICKITKWHHCSICWHHRSCGNMDCFDQKYQPGKITFLVWILIIKYLVAVSFG